MQTFQQCDLSAWSIAPPTTNSKGNRQAAIISNSTPISIQLSDKNDPLKCPFGASSWADSPSDRLNLDFTVPDKLLCFFSNADDKIMELAQNMSETLFGKQLSDVEIRGMYTPMLKVGKAGYSSTVRTKINTKGRRALKCYDMDAKPYDIPDDFRAVGVVPGILISHLWFQNKGFGVVIETTHAMIHQISNECPF